MANFTRLLVSPEVPGEIDGIRMELILKTKKEWTKTQINDAITRVGLRHLDEVSALLLSGADK